MVERKCSECGTWNKAERFCKNCNAPLHPDEVQAADFKKRDEVNLRIEEERKDKLDRLLEKARNSNKWYVRFVFYVIYSTWLVIFGVGAFFTYIIAWAVS